MKNLIKRLTLAGILLAGSSATAEDKDISQTGLDLIKESEGFEPNAYKCPAGIWTIGYGITQGVKPGDTTTKEHAQTKLNDYIEKNVEPIIDRHVKVPLNQNQFDALCSFIYNFGETKFKNSTLLRKLNNRDYNGAAREIPKWKKSNGKTLKGLVLRRAREYKLFKK